MQQRDNISEGMLAFLMPFTFVLLTICPGGFLWFLLPQPFGFLAALLCGCIGPSIMWAVARDVYGPRQ